MIKVILYRTAIIFSLVLILCALCVAFIQFYPFPKSQRFENANYPAVTTIKSEKKGDPINIMIIGSQSEITDAFIKAGWVIPDPITPETSARISFDSLAQLPYPTAPVSSLYLYNRKQDLAFEKPTNDVQIRDHIRLWDTGTYLGKEKIWLGSATFDNGIKVSSKTYMPTHHVDSSVDHERERVFQTLRPYFPFSSISSFTKPTLFGVNGGGDWYYTDGEIAILSKLSFHNQNFSTQNSMALTIKMWIFWVIDKSLGKV